MRRSVDTKHNWWKWAFLILVAILILGGAGMWYAVTRPIDSAVISKQPAPANDSQPVFEVTLTKQQAQRLANHYINEYLNSKDIQYHLKFDQHISLVGSADLLGSKIDFQLQTVSFPTTSGGVQLKAQHLKIGHLGIPLGFVLGYIQHNYHFPSWVSINSSKQLININLQDYQNDSGYYFKVKDLDLHKNKIVVSVYSSKF